MAKKRNFDPTKHMQNQIALMTTESIGYAIPFKIASGMPSGAGKTVATRSATIGSSLAGVPSLVHGSVGLIQSLDELKKFEKRLK